MATTKVSTKLLETVGVAEGGTGATSASAAFTAIKQAASTTATGVSELATTAETVTGTDTGRVVTPAGLHGALAGLTDTTIVAGDAIIFSDASDSGAMKEDTVQGILDLAGGGGSQTVLSVASISATSSFVVTGFNSTTYDDYVIEVTGFMNDTDNVTYHVLWSTDGGTTYLSSGYKWIVIAITPGSGVSSETSSSHSFLTDYNSNRGGTTAESNNVIVNLFEPRNSTRWKRMTFLATLSNTTDGETDYTQGMWEQQNTQDIDAIKWETTSGTFRATGTVKLIGKHKTV